MNRNTTTTRTSIAVLIAIVFAASIAHASAGTPSGAITVSQTFTLEDLAERLPVVHFAIHNPYYGGELKVYRGFYLADLIRLLTPAEEGVVHFEALDGYKMKMELAQIFDEREIVGLLAFEEVGGGFEPLVDQGRYIEEFAPYWLVWGHVDPSQVSDGGASLINSRPWPWQLTQVRIER